MKITWIGHSCFRIEQDGYAIVIDPYEDGSVQGIGPVREKADMVLCSHEHGDHNARGLVTLSGADEKELPFTVTKLETYHDDVKGAKRGPNTIHIISDGKAKIAHMGDLGCEPTAEQMEKLQGLDVMLVPVGGFFTIDAGQAATLTAKLMPKVVVPMHYRSVDKGFGFDVLGTVEEFTGKMSEVKIYTGSELDTEELPQAKVVVLQPRESVK